MRKIANSTCTECHYIFPRNEMVQRTVTEHGGFSLGFSQSFTNNSKRGNPRGGIRTYYRNKKVWMCDSCCEMINKSEIRSTLVVFGLIGVVIGGIYLGM